jgi:hypothetical protein
LPAPGGATSTAVLLLESAAERSGSAVSIGKDASKVRIAVRVTIAHADDPEPEAVKQGDVDYFRATRFRGRL